MVTSSLAEKSAFVTGAASGIGREIAFTLAGNGAAVTVADRNISGAESVASDINGSGGKALAVQLDVTDSSQVAAGVEAAVASFGSLDILVNVAGFGFNSPIVEMQEDDWDRVLGVNLKGQFLCSQAAARRMISLLPGSGAADDFTGNRRTHRQHCVYGGEQSALRRRSLLRGQGRGGAAYEGARAGAGGARDICQRRGAGVHGDASDGGVFGRVSRQLPGAGASGAVGSNIGHRQCRVVSSLADGGVRERAGHLCRWRLLRRQADRAGLRLSAMSLGLLSRDRKWAASGDRLGWGVHYGRFQ